jgi:hypothetical protein
VIIQDLMATLFWMIAGLPDVSDATLSTSGKVMNDLPFGRAE